MQGTIEKALVERVNDHMTSLRQWVSDEIASNLKHSANMVTEIASLKQHIVAVQKENEGLTYDIRGLAKEVSSLQLQGSAQRLSIGSEQLVMQRVDEIIEDG